MKVKTGCLFKAFEEQEIDSLAHVTNCQGVMGSGVALGVKQRYPAAYDAYRKVAKAGAGELTLGNLTWGKHTFAEKDQFIFNLSAQRYYGNGGRLLNYEAFYNCMNDVRFCMKAFGFKNLGVPYNIGCDRAGGSWKIVSAMIEEIFDNTEISVTAYKL